MTLEAQADENRRYKQMIEKTRTNENTYPAKSS
jgi:hypothetical protein